MATFTLFDETLNNIGKKLINLSADTFKAMLTNVAPNKATNSVKTDITEIAAGSGYTAGGFTMTVTWTETGAGTGVWRFNSTVDPTWTAAGGNIAAHQYLVVYDDTATNDELIGYVDMGSSSVIADGNTRTWDVGANGLFDMDATP